MFFPSSPDELRRLTRYDAWANRQFTHTLRDEYSEPIRLLAHVAASELLWLHRIEGNQPTSTTAEIGPDTDDAGCRALGVDPPWTDFVAFARDGN